MKLFLSKQEKLLLAAAEGDVRKVETLLRKLKYGTGYWVLAVEEASAQGRLEVLKALDAMPDPRWDRVEGGSLAKALLHSHGETADFLAGKGVTLSGGSWMLMGPVARGDAVVTDALRRHPKLRDEMLPPACREGRGPTVEALVALGAPVTMNDSLPLLMAVDGNCTALVSRLLALGAKPSRRSAEILDAAVRRDNPELLDILLKAGADPNAGEQPALERVILNGRDKCLEGLLVAGIDPTLRGAGILRKALHRAHRHPYFEQLVAAGANVDVENGILLKEAAESRDLTVVTRLLSAGADPNAGQGAALRAAVKSGNLHMLARLVAQGGDVNLDKGALLAEAVHDMQCLAFILGHGFDARNLSGPGLCAAVNYGREDRVRLILDAKPDAKSPGISQAISRAFERGYLSLVELLADRGVIADSGEAGKHLMRAFEITYKADFLEKVFRGVDPKSPEAKRALQRALEYGRDETTRFLLSRGVPIEEDDEKTLDLLLKFRDSDCAIQVWLANGGNPDILQGRPLREAVRYGRRDQVEILLNAGADPNACGEDILETCRKSGYREIAGLIEDATRLRDARDRRSRKHRAKLMHDLRDKMHGRGGKPPADAPEKPKKSSGRNAVPPKDSPPPPGGAP
jgi:ankyrin repeat protein